MTTTQKLGQEGFRWFIGVVEDTKDEDMLGRLKVRAFRDHDDLSTDDLPWATPMGSIYSESLNGIGISPIGAVKGSWVIGFYIDGEDANLPVILGTISKLNEGDLEKSDVHSLARGKQSLDKQLVGPEPESAYAAKYPENKTIVSRTGHVIEMDDTPGQERLHIWHKSGSYTEINKDGQWVKKVVGDNYDITVGNTEIYVGGSMNLVIKGDATVSVEGSATVNVGGSFDLTAGGDVTIKGATINLN